MKRIILMSMLILILAACSAGSPEEDLQPVVVETRESETMEPLQQPPTARPSATRTPTVTPTMTQTAPWPLNHAEVTELRFFEAGSKSPILDQREYSHQFDCDEARYIYYELNLEHKPAPDETKSFLVRAVYSGQGGEMIGELETQARIEPGWTWSYHDRGWGWPVSGNWEEGTYQVELYIGGEKVASDTFVMLKESPTPTATGTNTPTPTEEYKAVAVVDTDSLNVREGPGTDYGIVMSVSEGDELEIIGQAYACEWLKIETPEGTSGWVFTELVIYDMPCDEIPPAAIPPTPIPPPATDTPKPQDKSPGKTVKILIKNDTGGTLTLNLSGPASYNFTFGPGNHTINVVSGTYTYTAWGCGGASTSGTKKLNAGTEWRFFCS